MSPDTLLFGRLTVGRNRDSLGRGVTSTLMVRAVEQLRKHRVNDDTVITIELSKGKLPDSQTFDKGQYLEQQVAASVIHDPATESPFPGITVGRVAEVMTSPEYQAYEKLCDPVQRLGLTNFYIEGTRLAYQQCFPDCAPHFPKWIDS